MKFNKAIKSQIRDNRASEFTRLANILHNSPVELLAVLDKMGRAQQRLNQECESLISGELFEALAIGQMEVMDAKDENEVFDSLATMQYAASRAVQVINGMVDSTKAIARCRFPDIEGTLSREFCRNAAEGAAAMKEGY